MDDSLILCNARIRTMDPARPHADWVLITAGRVVALGQGAPPAATRRIDAGGRLVLPGFQDAHVHLLNGGVDLVETAQLYDCTTIGELQAALSDHVARWTGPMVWGAGWQCGFFGDRNLTREVLDAVVPDRPCLIYDGNFHNACINSVALALAGIADATPDPLNGLYVRDRAGRPTGMLHEDAIYRVLEALPKSSEATLRAGLLAGQAHANRHGTSPGCWTPRSARITGASMPGARPREC